MKHTFNCSSNKENYTQRNNEYTWTKGDLKVNKNTTCNSTSLCMGLDYAGFKFPTGKFKQPEDNLTKFLLEDSRVLKFYKTKMPAMYNSFIKGDKDAYTPNEVHAVMEYGVNLWLGTNAVRFSTELPVYDIFKQICIYNRPVITSGKFNNLNHVICIVGLEVESTSPRDKVIRDLVYGDIKPTSIIIDDPYGNMIQGYDKGLSGNDVVIPWERFVKEVKPFDNESIKWGYTFSAPAAVV